MDHRALCAIRCHSAALWGVCAGLHSGRHHLPQLCPDTCAPTTTAPADVHTYLPWSTEQDNDLLELAEQYTLVSSTVQRSTVQSRATNAHPGYWGCIGGVSGHFEGRGC